MELGKPVTFIFCILSLYALFVSAFLVPSSDMHQKICDSLSLLMLAAGMSLISGLIFVRATPEPHAGKVRLVTTLPVQLFVGLRALCSFFHRFLVLGKPLRLLPGCALLMLAVSEARL